jgi:exodeoxyribonuclease-3
MAFSITTWNINSVRLRIGLVQRFLERAAPDVLCLQETKCPNDSFPVRAFKEAGYRHIEIHGQKGYHGVATISRHPLSDVDRRQFCGRDDTRHIAVSVRHGGRPIRVHNFYVPAGGDEPDREKNWKFAHKLDFLDEMKAWLGDGATPSTLLVGDLNIAPLETDVWSHRQLLKVVSHTPVETQRIEEVRAAGGWTDVMRAIVPPQDKLFTWWSYRSPNWQTSDRGRRLDHVWASPDLAKKATAMEVLQEARSWEKPSDHVPVTVTFKLGPWPRLGSR